MSLQETKNKIKEIEETTKEYQESINNLQNKLIEFIGDVNKVNTSVKDGIGEEILVEHSGNASRKIVNKINKSLVKSRGPLDQLSTDATKEIKRLVDEYNNSIDPEDTEAEKLSYVTIKLTSVSGCPESYNEDSSSSSRNNNDNYYPPQPEPSKVDYYFSLLATGKVYSKDIPEWDEEVKKFLEENELDKVIKSIEINGKEIICTLINDKVYKFTDITNKLDFLKALYAAIEKEQNDA